MHLHEVLPLYLGGAREIVDLSPAEVDLKRRLRMPESVRYGQYALADADQIDLTADTLAVSMLGPRPPAQSDPTVLDPVLRRLEPGARAILLIGWPIPELPYHRLLGPLVGWSCQVLEAVPLDEEFSHDVHCALIVERVDRLAPLRSYLTDIPTDSTSAGSGSEPADDLVTLLRVANEYVLSDLVARPMRRRLIELEHAEAERAAAVKRADELTDAEAERAKAVRRADDLSSADAERADAVRRVDELSRLLVERDARVRQLERQLATLRSSASLQVGRALVDGVRHPGRAVVTVPREVARAWRRRRSKTPALEQPQDRVVPIALPSADPGAEPQRLLILTAPSHLVVPRRLALEGLVGYEKNSLACFLAATDLAGPGAVLDIGANVGLYAALASALTTREVRAFEPTLTLVDVARRFADDNGLGFITESMALSAYTGTATFYLSGSTDSSSSLAAGFRDSLAQVQVPVETLDSYLARTGVLPAVIKVDTESTEPDVLAGAVTIIAQHRPWILCEVLAGRVESRLAAVLTPFDYHWYHVTNEIPYREAEQIAGDPTYRDLMWLFAPERLGEAFWAALRLRAAALEACTVGRGADLHGGGLPNMR